MRRTVVAVLGVVLVPLGARADPADRPSAAAPTAPKAPEKKLLVSVFLQAPQGTAAKDTIRLQNSLRRGLRMNPRLQVIVADKRLAKYAGKVPTEAVARARGLLRRGLEALDAGKAMRAIRPLQRAIRQLVNVLAFTSKKQLAAAQFALARAYTKVGNGYGAIKVLAELMVWRPSFSINPDAVSRRFRRVVQRARARAERRRKAELLIDSTPVGAKVFLNGRYRGVTPFVLPSVSRGTHYLTLRREGYLKRAVAIEVKGARMSLQYKLQGIAQYLALEQALKRAWTKVGSPRSSEAMQEIRTILSVDQVVFVRARPWPEGGYTLDACLYDLRTRNRMNRVNQVVGASRFDGSAFMGMLYRGIRWDGTLRDPGQEQVKVVVKRRPLYKRWWFWVSIGAAVVATVTGIAVPLSRNRDTGPPAGFRPLSVRF